MAFIDGIIDGIKSVSYTHIDVYKRQVSLSPCATWKMEHVHDCICIPPGDRTLRLLPFPLPRVRPNQPPACPHRLCMGLFSCSPGSLPLTHSLSISSLGWSNFFLSQLDETELSQTFVRIAGVHRGRIDGLSLAGPVALPLASGLSAGELAIGDWVLSDGQRVIRRLDRKTELSRRAAGTGHATQLIAANVDTLFIVTSCNADFNPARLERYLALSAEAGTEAVVVLTKADTSQHAEAYRDKAARLQRGLPVLALDARDPAIAARLADWCRPGQTVALLSLIHI